MLPRHQNLQSESEEQRSVNTLQNLPVTSLFYPDRTIVELFLRQNPPIFTGAGNPLETEEWVRAIERIFKSLECSDKECLLCTSFLLKGPANFWWESRQKALTSEQREAFTWEQFKEEFYAKYLPRRDSKEKGVEFTNRKQGKGIATEYNQEFGSLTRYLPSKVETEEKMTELFRSVLRQEIRVILGSQTQTSYTETMNRTLDVEMEFQSEKVKPDLNPTSLQTQTPSKILPSNQVFKGKRKGKSRNSQNKKPWQKQGQPFQRQFQLSYPSQTQPLLNDPKVPPCPRCKRMHLGVCRWGSNSCYTCGQMGHYTNNCPDKPKQSGSGKRSNPSRQIQSLKGVAGYPHQQFPLPPTPQFQILPPPVPQFQNAPLQFTQFPYQPLQQPQQPQRERVFAHNQNQTKKNDGNIIGMGKI